MKLEELANQYWTKSIFAYVRNYNLRSGKTTDVINWFEKIDKKHLHTLTIFNIKDFYLSIKETLLKTISVCYGTYKYWEKRF